MALLGASVPNLAISGLDLGARGMRSDGHNL
jgi:hypothetical protein